MWIPPSYRKNLPLLKVHVYCDVSFIQNFITIAPYTVYQFRVQAATHVGFGPFSPPREFIMLESGKEYISGILCMHFLNLKLKADKRLIEKLSGLLYIREINITTPLKFL